MRVWFAVAIAAAMATSLAYAQTDSKSVTYYAMKRPALAAAEVLTINLGVWAFGHYGLDGEWTQISWKTAQANLRSGFEWDPNSFKTNFFGHPFHGTLYYGAARANGMTFWEAAPFTLSGSMMWELFMERHYPSINDLGMTTLGGIALGETLYRFSSQVLDDRARGFDRVWREVVGTAIDPMRGLNRLISGQAFHHSPEMNHTRSPIRGLVGLGSRTYREGFTSSNENNTGGLLEAKIFYGESFVRKSSRKPFDIFSMRFQYSSGPEKTNLIILQRGLLFGENFGTLGRTQHLFGVYQYYDYINTEYAEIGSMSIGSGFSSRFPLGKGFALITAPHASLIVLGASNTEYFTDDERDYNYGWGYKLKFEGFLLHQRYGSLLLTFDHYTIFTLDGAYGIEGLNEFELTYTIPVFHNWGIGVEYFSHRRTTLYNDVLDVRQGVYGLNLLLSYQF